MTLANRLPPQDLLAEDAVLGACFLSQAAIESVVDVLKADHFYTPGHRAVFVAMSELYKSNTPVDLVTVGDQLKAQGELEQMGGVVALAELANSVVSPGAARKHAEIVLEKARRRAIIEIGAGLIESAYDPAIGLDGFAGPAQKIIDSILEDRVNVGAQLPSVIAREHFEYLTLLSRRDSAGLLTGWHRYDRMTGGLYRGEVVCLAARPSRGKSVMALNIVESTVVQGYKVGLISLEMTRFSLLNRLYASRCPVTGSQFRKARFTDEDWREIGLQADWLSAQDQHLRIYDSPRITPGELKAQARKWKREMGGLDLLAVDYLQLMSGEGRGSTREREIAEASRAMKEVALGENCAVLALSQLNREVEKRPGKIPLLSDLRESGSIEQDSDIVLLMEVWDITTKSAVVPVQIYMAKGRDTQVASFPLHFVKKDLRFVNPPGIGAGV